MKNRLKQETRKLQRSWDRHNAAALCGYLVRDVEDPRINIQSILCRHFLIERLFGDRYSCLQEQEIRFGLVMNWLLRWVKQGVRIHQLQSVLIALLDDVDHSEEFEIPRYVSETFAGLSQPNYFFGALNWYPEGAAAGIPEYLVMTFERIWNEVLSGEHAETISVLEVACGSANDYRFFESYGIARFLEYRGIDLSRKNIANALRMFPGVCFQVGNAMKIAKDDASTDLCILQDLFEHLSIEAMEKAISEICRVTRSEIRAGFFNMTDQDEHTIRPTEEYHWNTLSVSRTKDCFRRFVSEAEAISIDGHLQAHYHCGDTHNKGAYYFIVKK
jgi:SAM-dependent methyltransferase